MLKKYACAALVVTLVWTLFAPRSYAQTAPPPAVKADEVSETRESATVVKRETRAGATLKADIDRLVSEARASKRLAIVDPQIQPKQSNSLSKGAKIAIIAGIAVVVILIIVIVHEKNHLFDDFHLGN
ncbi:MAG TPA: hypothetical protein VJT09_14670 [Pyrinomonadaceae bacterium]|nr:hypothetical protein [Pyrinomonadaceae bacterium]